MQRHSCVAHTVPDLSSLSVLIKLHGSLARYPLAPRKTPFFYQTLTLGSFMFIPLQFPGEKTGVRLEAKDIQAGPHDAELRWVIEVPDFVADCNQAEGLLAVLLGARTPTTRRNQGHRY